MKLPDVSDVLHDLLYSKKIPSVFRITGTSCYFGLPRDYDYVADPSLPRPIIVRF